MSQSLNPILGCTRSRARCWAVIQLSQHPEPSGHAVHGEVDGLDIGGQHGCGDLCVVASRDFSIVKRWLQSRQLGVVGVCISLRSLNVPFSVITVKCCCRCHRT